MSNATQTIEPIKLVRSLTEVSLEESTYKADLEVTDRYQNFSAELLRAALLGIGVFGFLLKEVILNEKGQANYLHPFISARSWFVGGLAGLAFSAAFALAHRYVSSDCIAYQIRYLRLKSARDEALKNGAAGRDTASKRNEEMQIEKDRLAVRLKRGGHTLLIAAVTLALGVALIAIGFTRTIFATTAAGVKSIGTNAVSLTSSNMPVPLPKP